MELFTCAQSTGLRARLEDGGGCQELPLDPGLQPRVLQAPDVPCESGVVPLAGVFEIRLVVAQPALERGVAHAHVPLRPLADGHDVRLVNDVVTCYMLHVT